MNNKYVIINGELLPETSASILVADLSIQRGYGVFDFFITHQSVPIFLADHLNRLYYSAEEMHLEVGYSKEALIELITMLTNANQMADSGIRITITGGYSEDGYSIGKPNLIITQNALAIHKNMSKGVSLVTYNHLRQLPHIKTINYLQAIYLQPYIKKSQADDVLYYHDEILSECPRANLFIVTHNDEIITPSNNILKGITRSKILSFNNFTCIEADITRAEMYTAKEAFITSTTKNILPVVQVDGKIIGDGLPGKITAQLFAQLVSCKFNDLL